MSSFRRRKTTRFRHKGETPRRGFKVSSHPVRKEQSSVHRPMVPDRLKALFRSPWRTLFVGVALWLGVGMLSEGGVLVRTPLEAVRISGRERLPVQEVLHTAGLSAGLSMSAVDPYEVAHRLAVHPRIRSADVRRVYPGRVAITLHERIPALRVVLPDVQVALVDSEGVWLPSGGQDGDVGRLPLISGISTSAEPGQRLDDPALARGQAVLMALAQTGVAHEPGRRGVVMEAGDPFLLNLHLPDGRWLTLPPALVEPALRAYEYLAPRLGELSPGSNIIDFSALDAQGTGRVILRHSSAP